MEWKIKEKAPDEFLLKFPEIHPVISGLLYLRGITEPKEVERFLDPDYYEDLHDPFLMLGMKEGVERIAKALSSPDGRKEQIVVFGDYDADGVCASAILAETLKLLNADVDVYIPDREKDGYGINKKAIEEFIKQKVNLVITVDCGITNIQEAEFAKENGIDVIITDHHPVIENKIPQAAAVIDPKREDDSYPYKQLAGAGVAYKLVCGLFKYLSYPPRADFSQSGIKEILEKFGGAEGYLKWILDLAAIGTVADICPLSGENRVLVKFGLMVLEKNRRAGLSELLKISGLFSEGEKLSLNAHNIGFQIGPRLNAAGRMNHASSAYQLIAAKSSAEARELAMRLDESNRQRQKLVEQIIERIKNTCAFDDDNVIFDVSSDCPAGVAGLVAGKLTEEFNRPSFIMRQYLDGAVKGSARSTEILNENGYQLNKILTECKDILTRFGGHAQAAGFVLQKEKIGQFREKLNALFAPYAKFAQTKSSLDVDYMVKTEDISWELLEQVKNLAPFGEGNKEPILALRNVMIAESRIVGNEKKHLKLKFKLADKEGKIKLIDGIAFGAGETEIKTGDIVDIAFSLDENVWNGNRSMQLKVKDIKIAADC